PAVRAAIPRFNLNENPERAISDHVLPQRRIAVEADRRIGRGIGAGRLDQDFVANRERDRQRVRRLLVEHVDRVAGRAGNDARRGLVAIMRGADRVADRLADGLGEAVELADVEIDPADLVFRTALGDQHHFGLDDAGIADQATARLDECVRQIVAEVLAQGLEDRLTVGFELWRFAHIARRKAAAEIDDGERNAAFGAGAEDRRGRRERAVPSLDIVLLRADMERDAVRHQALLVGELQNVGGINRLAAEFARQRPLGPRTVAMDAANDPAARRGAGDLLDLGFAIDREKRHATFANNDDRT